MKKSILKAALICLGVTLLCGLYSFRTPERVKTQQNSRTASIVYDTIITLEGEVSRVIKEVVVESDQSNCVCSLYVEVNETNHSWVLWIKVEGNNDNGVRADYEYRVIKNDGTSPRVVSDQIIIKGNDPVHIDSGTSPTVCDVKYVDPCFMKN